MIPAKRVQLELLEVGRCRHPECITLRGGAWRAIDFPSICALIVHPQAGPILFDTGYAAHFLDATQPFPERLFRWVTPPQLPADQQLASQLATRGIAMQDVRTVIVSHLHADHVAGLRDLRAARFLLLASEARHSLRQGRLRGMLHGVLPALLPADFAARMDAADDCRVLTLDASLRPFQHGYDLLGDGSLIGIALPGHSAGQLGVLLRDQHDRLRFLVADACWSTRAWAEQRPPAWPTRLLMYRWHDYIATLAGLKAVAQANPGLHILPSHCTQALAQWRRETAA